MQESKKLVIEETINPSIKRALYSNFSNAHEAVQEIIDNSISHRILGEKMQVRLFFIHKPKKIEIQDFGGDGMDFEALKFFFNWGGQRERSGFDIGMYGQGGKSAIGYLGRSFVLTTSPNGSQEAYRLEDLNLEDITSLKKYNIEVVPANSLRGYTKVEIGDLKCNVTDKLKNKIKESVLSTYRPLIEHGEVELFFDEEKVLPENFPLDKKFREEKIQYKIERGEIIGWIGRLMPRSGCRGGLRCYYKGRLICDREFFGHPDPSYKGTLNFLFGEVFLDFVPVNTNKTDFRRDSIEWEKVQEMMYLILKPHIDELLGRKVEEPTQDDIDKVKKARDIFQRIMQRINKNDIGIASSIDYDFGQKPRAVNTIRQVLKDSIDTGRINQPRTPPPVDKVGVRKRLKNFMDWEIRPMEESIRSKIEDISGGKVLVINNMFSAYKESKANYFYLLETAALQTVPMEDELLSSEKYLEAFDRFFGEICEHLEEAKIMIEQKKK